MKIIIGANAGGFIWGHYTIYGTKKKPRDLDLIEILDGNPEMGDRLTAQGRWKENEYNIILGFKGKPPRRVIRKALKDFKKHFMAGFNEDEYHFDAVAHFDTDDTHIHVRIPKMNVKTGTQLQLYFHAKDVDRINLIRDDIVYRYDLDTFVNEKPLIEENRDIERIQKWRAERNQEPLVLSGRKKDKEATKQIVSAVIKAEHEAGTIDSLEDLRWFFAERYPQYKVSNEGYDIPRDFHYFTIMNKKGETLRLNGDYYSEEFWKKSRELRLEQFQNNNRDEKPITEKVDVAAKLELATKKRIEEVEAKYRKARERVSRSIARQEAIVSQAIGREEARERKAEAQEKQDELSRRVNQTVRSGVSTGEVGERARARSIEERVCLSVAELITDSFIITPRSVAEASERRDSEANHGVVDSVGIRDTSERRDSITATESYSGLCESIRQLEGSISTFADEVKDALEADRIEAETEQFGVEFEDTIRDRFRSFKQELNRWAERYFDENRRRIEEYERKIGEKIDSVGEAIGRFIDRWNKDREPREARIRNAEKRIAEGLRRASNKDLKPKPT